jgi:uncharacterized protein (TIGR00290 family)
MNVAQSLAVASWSGGKDSCLAVWRAEREGLRVETLLTMYDERGARSRSHGLPPSLLRAQAMAMNRQWRAGKATWQSYEPEFIAELRRLRQAGHSRVVFGDIDLLAHREWEEKVCGAAGMTAVLPLWHQPRVELVDELWKLGFRATVVCTDDRFLGPHYCGREFDRAFVTSLPPGVDACGENGEFHTFVHDGPLFAHPVDFEVAGITAYTAPPALGGTGYHFAELRERSVRGS